MKRLIELFYLLLPHTYTFHITYPYGITCRFFNTHKENCLSESLAPSKKSREINNLSKDLQRLLWKNKVNFPKADAQLKLLGLKVCTKMEDLDSIC